MNNIKDEGQLNELAFLFGIPPEVAREFRLLWDRFEPKTASQKSSCGVRAKAPTPLSLLVNSLATSG